LSRRGLGASFLESRDATQQPVRTSNECHNGEIAMIKLFSTTKLNSMEDLLLGQIRDLYDAEKRLIDALPKVADAAHDPQLKAAFMEHSRQTEGHARKLERVFSIMGKEPERETCEAMQGLLEEGEEMISAQGDPAVKDAGLIAAAQRVEHYEISAYGSARTFAERLGLDDVVDILQEILDEEKQTDKKLTQIAEQSVNAQAMHRV
jgi:ferritin-like metal-binding protein YciE